MNPTLLLLHRLNGQLVGRSVAILAGCILLLGTTAEWASPTESVSPVPGLGPEFRAKLGKVVVLSSGRPAEFRFQRATGQASAPGAAAGAAARAILHADLPPECAVLAPLELPVAGIAAVTAALLERGHRVTPSDLRLLEQALSRAAGELINPDFLREPVLRIGNEKLHRSLRVPSGANEQVSGPAEYSALNRLGIDTVLEVQPRTLALERLGSSDESYALKLEANVKLVRTRDAKLLYAQPVRYRSGTALFVDWTLNDAQAFRAQVERGYALMAREIVGQLFLEHSAFASPPKGEPSDKAGARSNGPKAAAKPGSGSGIVNVVGPALTPSVLADLRRVGIVATSTIPKLTFERPLSKSAAAEEARQNAEFWLGDWEKAGLLGMSIDAATVVPLSVAEQAIGGIKGLSDRKLAQADDAITRAIQNVQPQERIRQRVLELARQRTKHSVGLVPKALPPGLEQDCSQMSCFMAGTLSWVPEGQTREEYLRSQGFDDVLEIELIHPAFKQAARWVALPPDANPPLALKMEVCATLRRVGQTDALYSFSFAYQGAARKFSAWAANGAEAVQAELERCYAGAAEQIVDLLAVHAWAEDVPMQLAERP